MVHLVEPQHRQGEVALLEPEVQPLEQFLPARRDGAHDHGHRAKVDAVAHQWFGGWPVAF